MLKVTAIIETRNDERRLGRLLETLRACDEVVVADHGSRDRTLSIARAYGAKVVSSFPEALAASSNDWVLVLRPDEGIHESFEASLLEWKLQPPAAAAYAVAFLSDADGEKTETPPEVRLVHRAQAKWTGGSPDPQEPHLVLEGVIGRFPE